MAEQPVGGGQHQSRPPGASAPHPAREKLGTGAPSLDLILGGGIPRDSLCLITGPPGAGKTILALQISFAAARQGLQVIYFTNVSEPHAKLVEHMRGFGFYEPDLVGDRIRIYNITSQVRNKGFKETLDFIVDTVRSERAGLVIVDSFRGLKHVLDVSVRDRSSIFDLAAQLSILGCTALLVGEYTALEAQTEPEFAIADSILSLGHMPDGMRERRQLRLTKMRGFSYLHGSHSFVINTEGLVAYPRQEALVQAPSYRATNERISTGLQALDDMLFGGLIRSSSTLIAGSAGTGKTVLSLHFLAAGAQRGEPGLIVSFQENPEQLALRADQFGIGAQLGIGQLTEVLFLSPVELDLDAAAAAIRETVERLGVRRIVIDSVAELENAAHEPERFDDFLASLVGFMRGREVTTLMTREIPQIFGSDLSITSRGLSYIVDNILILRYVELAGQIRRAITVLKNRGSDHDKSLHELMMRNGKVMIGETFEGYSGLMSGTPRRQPEQPGSAERGAGGHS
jgi:circadian clock protein KaiC